MNLPTIAVDLDGVILSYDRWRGVTHFGEPIPGARDFLLELKKFSKILIYTTRCCVSDATLERDGETPEYLQGLVRDYLLKHDLPFDDIYIGQGKPLYSCICDDRAVACRPQEDAFAYSVALTNAKKLCKVVAAEAEIK